jgi:hypothetical protein
MEITYYQERRTGWEAIWETELFMWICELCYKKAIALSNQSPRIPSAVGKNNPQFTGASLVILLSNLLLRSSFFKSFHRPGTITCNYLLSSPELRVSILDHFPICFNRKLLHIGCFKPIFSRSFLRSIFVPWHKAPLYVGDVRRDRVVCDDSLEMPLSYERS